MPVIRFQTSEERLKKWAEPLEDTTESAFVKVLNAAEQVLDAQLNFSTPKKPKTTRSPHLKKALSKLPEKEFRPAPTRSPL